MLQIVGSIADVAEGQTGLVTERQAAACGASPAVLTELLEGRVIETVVPGVVRLRGGTRHPFPQLYAHWLLLAPDEPAWERLLPAAGVVSHGAAVRVYAVGNLPGPAAEFTVPPNHTSTSSQDVLIHHAELGPQDFREIAGLPVTSPGRTLADIAAAGSTDLEGLGRIATNLLQRRLATQAELAQALETLELPGNTGTGTDRLSYLLASVDGTESAANSREDA
ncbi:hypothetical protein PV379_10755 [Streptomyces caniscabiei]|uniref:hypothetical protein n=1 Tax=Streptomyces caniscabiei TaxID=2746961 RepID=UPI0029B38E5E|nr:hypothetical protein [Streptomyces caniscabiei]MDX2601933.1 hypothetical protein [Streptomyces caniscabiei]MDX2737368.1 hypothetical protein [Streptomyces caniscabiei]MDX2777789.1 hypothetical protein [Streptomyces caniscabiei]